MQKRKCKKIPKNFQKRLDKHKKYVIILKCVIIVFFFGGFLPFFQGVGGKITKISQEKCTICPKKAIKQPGQPKTVNF